MFSRKSLAIVLILMAALMIAVVPAAAQDRTNTVTVTGVGTVSVSPDTVAIDLGVETFNTDVRESFSQANTTLRAVVQAIRELGVGENDINTSNLSIYNTSRYDNANGLEERGYQISNTVRVTVRDIALIEQVIDAAIGAGANSIYGLTFMLADQSAVESQARELAVQDANSRATQLAGLVGASLGEVIAVDESVNAFSPLPMMSRMASEQGMGGGGGAFVAPGQIEVTIHVSVMYQLAR